MTDVAIDTEANPYLQPMNWGEAPPAQAPVQPAQPQAPLHLIQGQPGVNQLERPQAPPQALQPTAPPLTPGVSQAAPAFDDEQEFQTSLRNEADAFAKNKIDTLRGEPSFAPQLVDPKADERIREINELRKLIPKASPKEQRALITQLNATEGRIMREIKDKNSGMQREADKMRADQLRTANAPFQDPEKRQKTAEVVSTYIGPMIQKYTAGISTQDVDPATGKPRQYDMNNPAIKNSLTYTYQTSPLSTLKPIELRDAVTNIAMANPSLSNDMALRMALAVGSPAELRAEWMDPDTGEMRKGNPDAPGRNGLRGKGATNYQVLGRDPNRNMWVLQVGPQQLRVDDPTYQRLVQARVVGYNTARKVMAEQAKPVEPNVFQRAAKPVEELIQRFR